MATQSNVSRFPAWFPPNCPPADAADAEGVIYRFVSNHPSHPDDHLSYHETGQRPNARACERGGLSVFRTAEEVRRLLRHLWNSHKGKTFGPHIVKRGLTPADGKIKETGGHGHHTWWAYEGVERHASFELVETVVGTPRVD